MSGTDVGYCATRWNTETEETSWKLPKGESAEDRATVSSCRERAESRGVRVRSDADSCVRALGCRSRCKG
eukprot:3027099-Rhodomonas_salina.2